MHIFIDKKTTLAIFVLRWVSFSLTILLGRIKKSTHCQAASANWEVGLN